MAEESDPAEGLAEPAPAPAKPPANPIRRLTLVVLVVALFVYGLFADRLTPYTDQATVRAYVVSLAPDLSGRVKTVNVVDNQAVQAGAVLFTLDPERYEIAVETAEAQLATAGQGVGASTASLAAAEAKLAVSQANYENAKAQTDRVMELVRSGIRAVASADSAKAALHTAIADVGRARAEVEQARQSLGPRGAGNPELHQAQAAVRKARRDMTDTVVRAPSDGAVTNLQLAPGRYVAAGQTALTFIDSDIVWIDAELRENALELIKVGDPVGVALDVRPGRVYAGKVESIGWGVDNRDVDQQTGLPIIKNDNGWVREPQRFAVRVVLDPRDRPTDIRVGSQAGLVIYTRNNPLTDGLGRLWIGLVSFLSYLN
jgi:multidrug resistance efflux pump